MKQQLRYMYYQSGPAKPITIFDRENEKVLFVITPHGNDRETRELIHMLMAAHEMRACLHEAFIHLRPPGPLNYASQKLEDRIFIQIAQAVDLSIGRYPRDTHEK